MKSVILLSTVLLLALSSCKKETQKIYKIDYSIGCTDCTVIYVSDQAGTQTSEYNKNSTWTSSFNAKLGQEILLLAYNTSGAPQGVTATINLNGATLESRTTFCPINGVSFCVDTVR